MDGSGVDSHSDGDPGKDSICNGSKNEEDGSPDGGEVIPDGIDGPHYTHARGKGVGGKVPAPFPSAFPRCQGAPVGVHAEASGRRTCAGATRDGRTANTVTLLKE